MLSEEFDKKIVEAADRHHPAYDEKAWEKMEKLLDKHLPEEKDDRRRFFFFLLFFLLLGGAGWIFFAQPGKNKKRDLAAAPVVRQNTAGNPTRNDEKGDRITGITPVDKDKVIEPAPGAESGTTKENNNFQKKNEVIEPSSRDIVAKGNRKNEVTRSLPVAVKTSAGKKEISKISQKDEPGADQGKPPVADNKKTGDKLITEIPVDKKETIPSAVSSQDPNAVPSAKANITPAAKETAIPAADKALVKNKKENQSNKKKNSLFFSVSAGPDLSATGSSGPGKVKLVGGGGIGYTYKDRISLRAGFYNSRKIYTAAPDEYHAPANFYNYYPNMQKIDADCRVYEIPVSLSYNFGHSAKHNWFASAGLSTYLMKRETYDIYYKYTPTSPTVSRKRTLLNANKHYFSVATFSGGYQYNINKTFSLSAEPYFKLPLKGVGYGKVKLNSAGILFTLSAKPFGHRKGK